MRLNQEILIDNICLFVYNPFWIHFSDPNQLNLNQFFEGDENAKKT